MKNNSENILKYAIKGVEEWENANRNIDEFLDRKFPDPALKKACTSLLFSYFRNKALIDSLIEKFAKKIKPKVRRVIAVTATQAIFQNGISSQSAVNIAVDFSKDSFGEKIAGFVNAVLRNICRTDVKEFIDNSPEHVKSGLPKDVYRRWKAEHGNEFIDSFSELLKVEAPITFRVKDEDSQYVLSELQGCEPREMDIPDWNSGFSFFKCTDYKTLFASNLLSSGKVYIQDPSTMLAPSLSKGLKADVTIDLCSAPGGKSISLSHIAKPDILIAADQSFFRQKRTSLNFRSHNTDGCVVIASAFDPPFRNESTDLVLLDVPCTNTGVTKRRPDALWNFNKRKLNELVSIQSKILASSAKLVKKGGHIIYSTCSIEIEENSNLIASFLEQNDKFKLISETQLIPNEIHDGAYAALLIKKW